MGEVTTVDLVVTVTVIVLVLVIVIVIAIAIVIVGHAQGLLLHHLVADTTDMTEIMVETGTEIEIVEAVAVEATTMIEEVVETEIVIVIVTVTEDGLVGAATVEETIRTSEEAVVMIGPIQVQTATSGRGHMTYQIGTGIETAALHRLDGEYIHLTVAVSAEITAAVPVVVI